MTDLRLQTLSTARLRLRPFTEDDADFILTLLNDPDWLRFIGDKQQGRTISSGSKQTAP